MKAAVLVREGDPEKAFEFLEVDTPKPKAREVLIKVSHSGLNYADVMARNGLYNDRPSLPCVLGYEVSGEVKEIGTNVSEFSVGDKVLAFTLFGGYSEFITADAQGVIRVDDQIDMAEVTALATQYATAWYSACHMINLEAGDRVLVHAAAGGVGTALVQIAKWKRCEVFGTAGNSEKLNYLKELEVDHVINYRTHDFEAQIAEILGKNRLDVVFDPIGGSNFKKSLMLLGSGGRIVTFGVSEYSSTKGGVFDKIRLALRFGFFHPIGLLMKSKSIIGVNMLRIGENKPDYLRKCMLDVYEHYKSGVLKPRIDSVFPVAEIAKAHKKLESRQTIGKVVLEW